MVCAYVLKKSTLLFILNAPLVDISDAAMVGLIPKISLCKDGGQTSVTDLKYKL